MDVNAWRIYPPWTIQRTIKKKGEGAFLPTFNL
jgi:hypothetical protein